MTPSAAPVGQCPALGRARCASSAPRSAQTASSVVSLSAFGARRPLPCLALPRSEAGQFSVGKPLAHDASGSAQEPNAVSHLAVVEPESLLVDVAEQVERLDAHVGAAQGPLEEAPEVLDAVGVDVLADVLLGGVRDGLVQVLVIDAEEAVRPDSSV